MNAVELESITVSNAGFSSWSFSCFKLLEISSHPLALAASVAITDVSKELGLSLVDLHDFFLIVEENYKHVPYHSSLHAADVVQAVHYLSNCAAKIVKFSPSEILALILSGVIHDIGHPVRLIIFFLLFFCKRV